MFQVNSGLAYVTLYVPSVYVDYGVNQDITMTSVIITHDGRMVCTNQAMLTLSDFSLSPI